MKKMRRLSADIVFPIVSEPITNGVVVLDNNVIVEVLDSAEGIDDVEFYKGALCPGFVNTHCHLELSHLHGKVSERKGMVSFIEELQSVREASREEIEEAIVQSDAAMYRSGISAVGDISNGSDSFACKATSQIEYYTFLEVFGFDERKAESAYKRAQELKKSYHNSCVSVVPHSPYSMSDKLLQLIYKGNEERMSIHNQESHVENEMFERGVGKLVTMLSAFGNDMSNWRGENISSLKSILPKLKNDIPTLFVHNTYSEKSDVRAVHKQLIESFWCLCPSANKYIENKLPNVAMLRNEGALITIGTDSLASNFQLNVLEELKLLQSADENISLNEMLTWATKNGANYLGFDHVGKLLNGSKPGVVHISCLDANNNLTANSRSTRLI